MTARSAWSRRSPGLKPRRTLRCERPGRLPKRSSRPGRPRTSATYASCGRLWRLPSRPSPLSRASSALVPKGRKAALGRGIAERLVDIYGLLTLLPGQTREYSRQEFARDIYLLDRSGLTVTRDEQVVSFPASTGTRPSSAS